jgi:hypothetical protein
METLRYDYKPKAWVMLLSGLFFAGCGVWFGNRALTNDRGLILNGIIELETGDATIFYWVLTAVCVAFVAGAGFGVVRALGAPGEVVLDATAITAPKRGTGRTTSTVPFAQITDLRITDVNSQKFLTIHHTGGKLAIMRSMMPDRAAFEELVSELHARCGSAQGR